MTSHAPPRLVLPVGSRDHAIGPENAPVTLVEYGDFECPHCRQVQPIVRDLQNLLGDRLRYVFRHFPIRSVHTHAMRAAEAAEAAGAQGKFWQMHDLLFEHQDALETDDLLSYAASLNLDLDRFRHDLEEGTFHERIHEDFTSGVRSGVNGTPSFFINGRRYEGAWDFETLLAEIEKPLGVKIRLLFQEFTRLQASGGVLLALGALLALVLANSGAREFYHQLWETHAAISFGDFTLSEDLLAWVNDGLMAIFFFVVGLEIKREITVGELSSPRRAALPVAAAIGGMVVPALLYAGLNAGGPGAAGWGVPMATDIAFTLSVLTVFGRSIPLSLKVFFTALAIADDLGAVLVIALFYTDEIHLLGLGVGIAILVVLLALNRLGVNHPLPYGLFGLGLWLAFLESGVHPTIAGVLLAMTIPSRTPSVQEAYLAQCITIFEELDPEEAQGAAGRNQAAAQALEQIIERMQSPAQRLERTIHPWTTYVILPIFALANAGLTFEGSVGRVLAQPISLGVIFGLVIGKPLGISLFSWLAVRLRLAERPPDFQWREIIAASFLAGIGFTMSIFIADAAFESAALLAEAKLGVFAASLAAAVIGIGGLALTTRRREQVTARGTEGLPAAAEAGAS